MAQVQLIFAGEVLDGFLAADVRRTLGERLKLDEQRLDKLFSGSQVIIKRGLSAPMANQWVAQFRAMGAKLHVRDEPLAMHPALSDQVPAGPAPAPALAPAAATPPLSLAPVAAAASSASTGPAGLQLLPIGDPHAAPPPAPIATIGTPITCPVCGDEQPKRILCRVCAADMPRGIAARLEEAEAERARRRDEAMARRGVRPGTDARSDRSGSAGASRFMAERHAVQADDEPLFGLSFEGRMGRMRYFLGLLLFLLGLFWGVILLALMPGLLTGVMLVVGMAFATVWNIRLTVLRLHDVGLTGWWVLASYVPWLGQIACLVLMLWPGDAHDNDHGEPPSQEGAKAAVAALVALSLSVAWGFKTAVSAFEQQVQQMQEEAESEDVGLDGDDGGATDAALPAADELRRVLRSDGAVDEFRRYMGTPGHRAFAISDAGAWGWHGGAARPNQAIDTALAECERRRAPYTPECRAVHLNNDWVMN
jgi:uncharacterized membrane protein YhaH (DUF805 family)